MEEDEKMDLDDAPELEKILVMFARIPVLSHAYRLVKRNVTTLLC